MKLYDLKAVSKLPLARSSTKQKPFPGRWPTRVLLVRKDGSVYLGKPFIGLNKNLSYDTILYLVEFDRASRLLTIDTRTSPRTSRMANLYLAYHPYGMSPFMALGNLITWFGSAQEARKIAGAVCYIPQGMLQYDPSALTFIEAKLAQLYQKRDSSKIIL